MPGLRALVIAVAALYLAAGQSSGKHVLTHVACVDLLTVVHRATEYPAAATSTVCANARVTGDEYGSIFCADILGGGGWADKMPGSHDKAYSAWTAGSGGPARQWSISSVDEYCESLIKRHFPDEDLNSPKRYHG
jgi:hypothetical protein